jgi:hypothetical protein
MKGEKPSQQEPYRNLTPEEFIHITDPVREAVLDLTFNEGALTQMGYPRTVIHIIQEPMNLLHHGECTSLQLNHRPFGKLRHDASFQAEYGSSAIALSLEERSISIFSTISDDRIESLDLSLAESSVYFICLKSDGSEFRPAQLALKYSPNTRLTRVVSHIPVLNRIDRIGMSYEIGYLDPETKRDVLIRFNNGHVAVYRYFGERDGYHILGRKINIDLASISGTSRSQQGLRRFQSDGI